MGGSNSIQKKVLDLRLEWFRNGGWGYGKKLKGSLLAEEENEHRPAGM